MHFPNDSTSLRKLSRTTKTSEQNGFLQESTAYHPPAVSEAAVLEKTSLSEEAEVSRFGYSLPPPPILKSSECPFLGLRYQTRLGFITSFMAAPWLISTKSFFPKKIFHPKSFQFNSVSLFFPLPCSFGLWSKGVRTLPAAKDLG